MTPAVIGPDSASLPIVGAFLNTQLGEFGAGAEEEPPQSVADSAEPEQVTTRLLREFFPFYCE